MKRCSVRPYEGDENYIFISYCHKDKAKVFPIIEQLAKDGFRVWYDEGIAPGEDWPEIIAAHLNACECCIAFISNQSLGSHNCKKEINYAVFLNKFFVSVFLEPVEMTLGMQMQLSTNQSILKYTMDTEYEFFSKLYDAKELKNCLGKANSNVIVSKPDDYSDDDIDIEKVRDPFSSSWFLKSSNREAKRTEDKTDRSNEIKTEDEIASLIKLIEEKEDIIHQLSEKSEGLLLDIQNKKKCDEEERIAAEQNLKEAENEVEILTERLQHQKNVIAQIMSAEKERIRTVSEREIAEKEEQEKLSAKIESEKKEHQKLVERLKDVESRLVVAQKKSTEQKEKTTENIIDLDVRAQEELETTEFILKRERTGQVINIFVGTHILGRSEALAKYCIEGNKKIGRSHATLIASKEKVIIFDNNSLNKTCINGSELEPQVKYLLKDGDKIKIANEIFILSKIL